MTAVADKKISTKDKHTDISTEQFFLKGNERKVNEESQILCKRTG